MEIALKESRNLQRIHFGVEVSILVIMELALKVLACGRCKPSGFIVSILVIMEIALKVKYFPNLNTMLGTFQSL
jgi:hypothetical protein